MDNYIVEPRRNFPSFNFIHLISALAIKPLKLNILMPLIGLADILKSRMVNIEIIPILILPLISFIQFLFHKDFYSLIKTIQLAFNIFFFNFLIKTLKKNHISKILQYSLIISIASIMINMIAEQRVPSIKSFLGFSIDFRYMGLTGEPNYSAIFSFFIFLISISIKKYKISIFSLIPILFNGSRAVYLAIFIFVTYKTLEKTLPKKSLKYIVIFNLILLPALPFITKSLYENTSTKNKNFLMHKSSHRIPYQNLYIQKFLNKPFGFGYYRSKKQVKANEVPKYSFKIIDQHNTYLQILTEFGIIGFLAFSFFIYKLFSFFTISKQIILISFLNAFYFVNGLNELSLYLFIGSLIILESNESDKSFSKFLKLKF